MESDKMLNVYADRGKMNDYWAREARKQFYIKNIYSHILDWQKDK
jgi:hypothetical protein